jgi:hypothetical protein
MLALLLKQPILTERPAEYGDGPRREAVVLPFSRPMAAALQIDWYAKYPCTRMHGAAFESEFYPASDDSF